MTLGATAGRPLEAGSFLRNVLAMLPQGQLLPEHSWRRRHACIVALLWLHVVGLLCFGVIQGIGVVTSTTSVLIIAASAVLASIDVLGRRARSLAAAFGLVSCSALDRKSVV